MSIEVEKGTRAIILQHIHSNLEALACTTSSNECIVSPVVTVHTMEDSPQHLMSHQSTHFIYIKKDYLDDKPIKLQSVSPIKPGKSQDQGMKLNDSPRKEDKNSDDDQPMKCIMYFPQARVSDEYHQPTKQEPLSPEEPGASYEDHPVKCESKEVRVSEKKQDSDDLLMKSEALSSEEAGLSDRKLSKLLPLVHPWSRGLDYQSMKPEVEPMIWIKDSDNKSKAPVSTVQTDFDMGHLGPDQPQHYTHKKMEEQSLHKFKLTIPHYVN